MDLNKEKLTLTTFELIDNSKYTISNEKPLLIYFWATWCPICKLQSPNIEELSKKYQIITIASQSGNSEEIKKYLKEKNLTFKVVNDEDNLLSSKFNIKAFPTTLIYDKDKNLEFSDVGYTSSTFLKLKLWFAD